MLRAGLCGTEEVLCHAIYPALCIEYSVQSRTLYKANVSYIGAFATNGVFSMEGKVWETKVKGLLKAELKRRNVTYAQLVEKLAAIGVVDSEPNIRNKLARGKFTAVFLVQCLEAIGASSLRLSDG
jgi:microsomal dipeptidase-like Zn-dependent dipeptidase